MPDRHTAYRRSLRRVLLATLTLAAAVTSAQIAVKRHYPCNVVDAEKTGGKSVRYANTAAQHADEWPYLLLTETAETP